MSTTVKKTKGWVLKFAKNGGRSWYLSDSARPGLIYGERETRDIVPVTITETTTPGELREAGNGDFVDGYVLRLSSSKYVYVSDVIKYVELEDAMIFQTEAEFAQWVLKHPGYLAVHVCVPVTRTSPTTTRTVEEVPAWVE